MLIGNLCWKRRCSRENSKASGRSDGMKVLLIRPNSEGIYDFFKMKVKKRILPPLGIMYLASYINFYSDEHDVSILDGEYQRVIGQEIKGFDIVGVGGTTPEYNQIAQIFKMVKEVDRSIVTVGGGVHYRSAK